VAARNATVNSINHQARQFFGYTGDLPVVGDKMICRRNSWDNLLVDGRLPTPLVNRLIGYVTNVEEKLIISKLPGTGRVYVFFQSIKSKTHFRRYGRTYRAKIHRILRGVESLDRLTLDRLFIIAFLFSTFGIIIALDGTIQRLKIDEKELLEKNKLRQEINELRQEISSLKKPPNSSAF
jgi:hypothetical protein